MAGKTFKALGIVLTDETEEEIRDLIEQIKRISGYKVKVANSTIVSEIKESDKYEID